MKKNKIILIVISLLLIGTTILSILSLSVNSKLKNNSTLYCVMEDSKKENKMEIFFDYKDGEIYKYSIINTNKMTPNINVDAYKDLFEKNNNKYKGATSKFWTDNNIYMTTEIYNLDLLSEQECKELTTFSKKDLKSKTRKEIIDSFIPMINDSETFKCN